MTDPTDIRASGTRRTALDYEHLQPFHSFSALADERSQPGIPLPNPNTLVILISGPSAPQFQAGEPQHSSWGEGSFSSELPNTRNRLPEVAT